jgi:hypothetical protein
MLMHIYHDRIYTQQTSAINAIITSYPTHPESQNTALCIPDTTLRPRRISRRGHRRSIPSTASIPLLKPPLTPMITLVVTLLHRWRLSSRSPVPALPTSRWRHRRARSLFVHTAMSLAAADAAAEDGEEEEAADSGADADDEGFVVVDPGADLTAY